MRSLSHILLVCCLMLLGARLCQAEERLIEPPDDREFVLDFADLVSKDDTAKISETGKKLFADIGVRLVVLTVNSMAHYNNADNIQAFTRKVLETWTAKQSNKIWAKSVLLVRAKDDKKFRIHVGSAWKDVLEKDVDKIMKDVVIPKFKANEISKGLLETTNALDKLVRKNKDLAVIEPEQPKEEKAEKEEKK